jgi:hypothetical protein
MCRNIKTLFNFEPPVTHEEVRASALQFVRKLSGFNKPSKVNEAAFALAVDEVTRVATTLLRSLETSAPPRDRTEEAAKARARGARICLPYIHVGYISGKGRLGCSLHLCIAQFKIGQAIRT